MSTVSMVFAAKHRSNIRSAREQNKDSSLRRYLMTDRENGEKG